MQMNNLENVLKYVDDLVTLTPIQEEILKGTYKGKKNFQIAQDFHCSESHIKKEAAKLWKQLGQELGENINK
jgi:DNA-binding NarL/FixJ family response regulator